MPRLLEKSKIDRESGISLITMVVCGSPVQFSGDWKLIFDYESNEAKLFDLKEDPKLNDISNLFNEEI